MCLDSVVFSNLAELVRNKSTENRPRKMLLFFFQNGSLATAFAYVTVFFSDSFSE